MLSRTRCHPPMAKCKGSVYFGLGILTFKDVDLFFRPSKGFPSRTGINFELNNLTLQHVKFELLMATPTPTLIYTRVEVAHSDRFLGHSPISSSFCHFNILPTHVKPSCLLLYSISILIYWYFFHPQISYQKALLSSITFHQKLE